MDIISIIIYVVLVFFALAIVARISGQTLVELFSSVSDWIKGKGEDTADRAVEIY